MKEPAPPRVLFVHVAQNYFAGAERMLQYFTSSLDCGTAGHELLACESPSFAEVLPPGLPVHRVPRTTESFTVPGLVRFAFEARRLHVEKRFDLVHVWHARGWEAGALIGKACGLPVVGTLHDHPSARFISAKRSKLMRLSARWGLRRVICVSDAVRCACLQEGYPEDKLVVIRNGLPASPEVPSPSGSAQVRFGFLGVFSERKGFGGLFQMLAKLAARAPDGWSVKVAGNAPDNTSKALFEKVRSEHERAPWWPRIEFVGWVKSPLVFLEQIDVLIVPSTDFDPFPTVLLEAAQASRPVVAANVGGVGEIVVNGSTGWMFDPSDWSSASELLAGLVACPERVAAAGKLASQYVRTHFSMEKMNMEHRRLYDQVLA